MYCRHFGFTKSPFKITPDPELFFPGGNRGAVLEALVYAIARGEGIVKVVGEVGSGKTMLCRMLERELPAHCEIVYLANPRLEPDEILHAIACELQLGVTPGLGKLEVLHRLQDYLLEKHAVDRRVVMFVEEAQAMPLASLEEIRLLSNLETTQEKLLQIVLFGQPELDTKLSAHEIRQLNERITYRFELPSFKPPAVRDYLNTRMRQSGYRGTDLFSGAAIRELARYSRGLLRRINILADKALLAAFSCNDHKVRPKHVRMAARDSEFTLSPFARPLLRVGLAVLILAAGAAGGYHFRASTLAIPVGAAVPGGSAIGPTVATHAAPATPPDFEMNDQDFAALVAMTAAPVSLSGSTEEEVLHVEERFEHLPRLPSELTGGGLVEIK